MRAQVTLQPGQKGTKKLTEQYGQRLVCVRYRYDEQSQRRLKTIELIVEETPWQPAAARAVTAGVRVAFQEAELQRRVKQAGGKWNAQRRLWEMERRQAIKLGLKDRIEATEASIYSNQQVSTNRNR